MYPRNKSLRDSSASSPPHSVLQDSFPFSMLSSFFVSILICHAKNIRAGMEPDILGPVHHLMFSMVSTMLKGRILVHMVLCVPWRWHLAVNAATSPTASEVFQASGWAGIYKY